MESKNPIGDVLNISLENLKTLVDTNTIIGERILIDGTTIIPISKVSFGFATGGSELPTSKPSTPFGGGSGGGVTITPIGFLTVARGEVKLLQLQDNTADRIVSSVPDLLDRIAAMAGSKKKGKDAKDEKEEPFTYRSPEEE